MSVWRHPLAFSVRGHEPSRRELSGARLTAARPPTNGREWLTEFRSRSFSRIRIGQNVVHGAGPECLHPDGGRGEPGLADGAIDGMLVASTFAQVRVYFEAYGVTEVADPEIAHRPAEHGADGGLGLLVVCLPCGGVRFSVRVLV